MKAEDSPGVKPKLQHDPRVRASECAACLAGEGGFDHEAALRFRPADFDQQVIAAVRTVARGATHLFGIALHPDAHRKAARWLAENDR